MPDSESKSFKLDVSSSVFEKGLDIAKNFVEAIIMPGAEQAGLMFADQVSSWRLSNQIRILVKAREKCEKASIEMNSVDLKLLVPFLENCSLESDDEMQDSWANMLANVVDSGSNINNHVFPYLMSQISKEELYGLRRAIEHQEGVYKERGRGYFDLKDKYDRDAPDMITERDRIILLIDNEDYNDDKYESLKSEMDILDYQIGLMRQGLSDAKNYMHERIDISHYVSGYEVDNMVRLGLFGLDFDSDIQARDALLSMHGGRIHQESHRGKGEIVRSTRKYYVTNLGQKLIEACFEGKAGEVESA